MTAADPASRVDEFKHAYAVIMMDATNWGTTPLGGPHVGLDDPAFLEFAASAWFTWLLVWPFASTATPREFILFSFVIYREPLAREQGN